MTQQEEDIWCELSQAYDLSVAFAANVTRIRDHLNGTMAGSLTSNVVLPRTSVTGSFNLIEDAAHLERALVRAQVRLQDWPGI